MGSTPLKPGDPPSPELQRYRLKYGGRAELRDRIVRIVERASGDAPLAGIAFTLKHRPPRDLEAIEKALLNMSADVEEALAHVRRMRVYHDMPVSDSEYASQHAELVAILRGDA